MTLLMKIRDAFLPTPPGRDPYFLDWDGFVRQVEVTSGVRDTDKVLQILIGCQQKYENYDLCTIVKHEKRGFLKRFFFRYREDDVPDGYLLMWDHSGVSDHIKEAAERRRQEAIPHIAARYLTEKNHVIEVPHYSERRAWEAISWGELKELVSVHPMYHAHKRIGKIDISACKAEHIEISRRHDNEYPHAPDSDLMIVGRTPAAVEQTDAAPGWVAERQKYLESVKKAAEKQGAVPEWAQKLKEGKSDGHR